METDEKKTVLRQADLDQFIGTQQWWAHWTKRITFTDGVKYLAETAGAFWLVDAIASWQIERKEHFQLWELHVNRDETPMAVLTMREDCDQPELIRQEISYTDFPLEKIKLYLIDGVLLLPSEY
jgi:hypothetical protein